jgi:hypothetical protein
MLLEEQQSGAPAELALAEVQEVDAVVTSAVQIDEGSKTSMCCAWY